MVNVVMEACNRMIPGGDEKGGKVGTVQEMVVVVVVMMVMNVLVLMTTMVVVITLRLWQE